MNKNSHAVEAKITYLVYAPEYVHWSAGIKVLYKLHDALKETGREVYLLNHGRSPLKQKWKTSRLVSRLNREKETRIFVAIYTESIKGNPLKVKNRIRWILNYPGLLGGPTEFEQDYILAYSHNIAKRMMRPRDEMPDSLFIAALTPEEVNLLKPTTNKDNRGSYDLLYAQKFRSLGGIPIVDSTTIIEITRFDGKAQTREETLRLTRNANALHVFENSTIILEAQLSGVPVFCHGNEYFEELIAEIELGNEGISWNLLEYPKVDSLAVRSRLIELESSLLSRVDICFSRFEDKKLMTQNGKGISFGAFSGPLKHRIQRFSSIRTNRGARTALRFLFNFLKRSIFPNPWNRKLNRLD